MAAGYAIARDVGLGRGKRCPYSVVADIEQERAYADQGELRQSEPCRWMAGSGATSSFAIDGGCQVTLRPPVRCALVSPPGEELAL